jgi:thiol:disulfide interchange protein DsbA
MKRAWTMRVWMVALMFAALLGATPAGAAAPVSGHDFLTLPVPQPVSPAGKVVVMEFFWYDCPHCAEFEPTLEAWARQLPPYVVLERVPVMWGARFVPQQRLYYALLALGKVGALQARVFAAIHQQGIKLETPEQMADWLQKQGVPRQQFLNAYNSFSVQMQARRAAELTTAYQIQGVPSLAVQGRYVASADLPGTPSMEAVLRVVDALIAQVHGAH